MQGDLKRVRQCSHRFEGHKVVGIQLEDDAGEKGWHIMVLPEGLDYWVPSDGEFYGISGNIDRVQSICLSTECMEVTPAIRRAVDSALAEWE
jgi:hypothetical protein